MSLPLYHLNTPYIESLLHQYESTPHELEPSWRAFFDGLFFANGDAALPLALDDLAFEFKVFELFRAYRQMGHLIADVDPLDRSPKFHPLLELARFGLTEADLGRRIRTGEIVGLPAETLGDFVAALRARAASPVAIEFSHITDPAGRRWIDKTLNEAAWLTPLPVDRKRRLLTTLLETEILETFLHQRFVAQKRFSAEGNDAITPMMDELIEAASEQGTEAIAIGMAHRGRLSLLVNVLKKDVKAIFAQFSGNLETDASPGEGDVKYHLGFSGDLTTRAGRPIHVSLVSNPSHLEAVNAVVAGIVRAKQTFSNDGERRRTLAVLLHGDASFAGQGCIYELLNMSELEGYAIGGTVHIIINNQIGFTTLPQEGRSTPHATDIAKMIEAPIFRVNADEPEHALQVLRLALEYRSAFKRDVFIDLIGYRRYGHNEGDEPSFTQPLMYQRISKHPRVAAHYAERLIAEGVVSADEVEQERGRILTTLDSLLMEAKKNRHPREKSAFEKEWKDFVPVPPDDEFFRPVATGVDRRRLTSLAERLSRVPDGFHVHPKISRFLEERREMRQGKRGVDWGYAEALAFASLLSEGYPIRLAGQDSARGTFSHRHSVLHDVVTGEAYIPLNHLDAPASFEIVNSPLSEFAAMAFEFGQSLAAPKKLVLWEAQFGDFANGGQIVIDQFISGSAFKWQRYSGLVLLLPHGYEGQGPEHSSARIERFLQLTAQHNLQVCNVTTPAQYFHLLRRQMLRPYRLPLILMTPKSTLRHPRAVSSWADLETGTFGELLDDPAKAQVNTASRLILCSGKIYYELLHAREAMQRNDIPLIRVEQFYPFPKKQWVELLRSYKKRREIVWCQEEPQNMGGYGFVRDELAPLLDQKASLQYVGRPAQANAAGGYAHVHEEEQRKIVEAALT